MSEFSSLHAAPPRSTHQRTNTWVAPGRENTTSALRQASPLWSRRFGRSTTTVRWVRSARDVGETSCENHHRVRTTAAKRERGREREKSKHKHYKCDTHALRGLLGREYRNNDVTRTTMTSHDMLRNISDEQHRIARARDAQHKCE